MQKVTKAIIAAAGLNSRMYPFTKVHSKLFIPIINKPMIQYLVEELSSSGIKEVIIVSTHTSKIKQFFSEDEQLHQMLNRLKKDRLIEKLHHIESLSKIDLIRQEEPRGWMHEVWHARKYVKDAPFIVCFSDILYDAKIPAAKQVIDQFQKVNKHIRTQSRFLFKPSLFEILKKEKYPFGQDSVDNDVFERLQESNDLYTFNINGTFHNIGDPLSYMKTQAYFGLKHPGYGKEYRRYLKTLVR